MTFVKNAKNRLRWDEDVDEVQRKKNTLNIGEEADDVIILMKSTMTFQRL